MKLDEARAVALMLTEGDVTAWIQMTIIENEYKVNFVILEWFKPRKFYNSENILVYN